MHYALMHYALNKLLHAFARPLHDVGEAACRIPLHGLGVDEVDGAILRHIVYESCRRVHVQAGTDNKVDVGLTTQFRCPLDVGYGLAEPYDEGAFACSTVFCMRI